MEYIKMKKYVSFLILLLTICIFLAACGKQEEPRKIVNSTLPDISEFQFETPTPAPVEQTPTIRYSPRGNYTFYQGIAGHFYVYSVDYEKNIVELSYLYYIGEDCYDSKGKVFLPAEITDIGETGRLLILNLEDGSVLKFDGTSSGKGTAHFNELILKHEG
jgi:hypothetical protein